MKALVFPLSVLLAGGLAQAQIRTDASLGQAAQTLAGPNFLIPQALGKVSGSNLFHSFQTFNLATGEAANFSTSSAGISNVISRVTGGELSRINGTLRLTAAGNAPAFFFINPAGVTFGTGASVDVPGAFHVSSANSLKFFDGRFDTDLNQASTLSSAAPEAFGFAGRTRATVAIGGGVVLKPKREHPIGVVAGDIVLDEGGIGATAGAIRAVAVGATAADIALAGALPLVSGNLAVTNGGFIIASDFAGSAAGAITVRSGDVLLATGGNIASFNAAADNAGDIQMQAQRISLDSAAYVYSSAMANSSGRGAAITLLAADGVVIRGGASVSSDTFSAGAAGGIQMQARSIALSGGGYVASDTYPASTGETGRIGLTARDAISLSDQAKVYVTTAASGGAGRVELQASDITLSSGAYVVSFSLEGGANAGSVELNATRGLTLLDGASLFSVSNSTGNAGAVRASATDIRLDTNSKIASTAGLGSGNGGTVDVLASGELSLRNGSLIDSSTFSAGQAGSIKVAAGAMTIDSDSFVSSIAAAGSGNAGRIDVLSTDRLTLSNGGAILSNTFTRGNAGSVQISANHVGVESGGRVSTSTLGEVGSGAVGGNGGNIRITATGEVSIKSGSLSATSLTSGRSGNIEVAARSVTLDGPSSRIDASAGAESSGQIGSVSLRAQETIAFSNGASASIVNLGSPARELTAPTSSLTLSAPVISLANAALSASSFGSVAASAIALGFSDQLALSSSRVSTNTLQSDGGAIALQGGGLIRMTRSQITTSVAGATGNGGNISISADALAVETGFIQANTFATNASGGLVNLNLKTLAASGNLLFVGGPSPYFFTPAVFGFNVIQAAAPTGVSGAVQITSPVLDLSNSLGRLGAQVTDVAQLGRTPCQATGGSSLVPGGQGSLPVFYRSLPRPQAVAAPDTNGQPAGVGAHGQAATQLALFTPGCR